MRPNFRLRQTFVWLGLFALLPASATEARAAILNVSTTAQLESAVANAAPGDVIVLAPGLYLPSASLDVLVDLTIQGDPSAPSIIDGGGLNILRARAGLLQLDTLTLRNGFTAVSHDSSGTVVIRGVTITGNAGPGVASDSGHVRIINSTIAGNATGVDISCATLVMFHVTVSGNQRGLDINFPCGDSLSIRNTVIADNEQDCVAQGSYTLDGFTSLDSDGTCRAAVNTAGDPVFTTTTQPGLFALADNGGPTATVALAASSPAVDAGSVCVEPFDQRLAERDVACDIGAFERAAAVVLPSATGAGTVRIATSSGTFLRFHPVAEADMPNQAGKPAGVTFRYGFFDWSIGVPSPGATADVTFTFPTAVPTPPQYWKPIVTGWIDLCLHVSCAVNGNRLTLTLRDGDIGDLDGIGNSVIVDPGGLGQGGDSGDTTAPAIAIAAPRSGVVYVLNAEVVASYACTDAGAGIASCAGTVPSGANVPTGVIGAATFSVTASDQAGNTASAAATYGVTFGTCLLYDPGVAKKSGSTYPVKLQLCDAAGRNVSSPSLAVHATGITQTSTSALGPLDDSGNANPDFDFRYDASFGGYIFNVKTTGLTTGTYNLHFTAGSDSIAHAAPFSVK